MRRLELSKFRVFVTWPMSQCYSASWCKISLKLYNLLLSYSQKTICNMAAVRHLELNVFFNLVTWQSLSWKSAFVCRMSAKSGDFLSRYGDFTISAILNFRGRIMGSLKSPCMTFYRSSIEAVAVNCLAFEKNCVFIHILATDGQTDGQGAPLCKATSSLSRAEA